MTLGLGASPRNSSTGWQYRDIRGFPGGGGRGWFFERAMGACSQDSRKADRVNDTRLEIYHWKIFARDEVRVERNDLSNQSQSSNWSLCSPTRAGEVHQELLHCLPSSPFWL